MLSSETVHVLSTMEHYIKPGDSMLVPKHFVSI